MRLTSVIKQQIVNAAIAKAGIPDEAEALRLRRVAWAEAVRVDALGGKEGAEAVDKAIKAIEKIMSSIPSALAYSSGAIRHDSSMYVNCGGLSVRARFIGNRGDCFDIRACTVKPTVDSHTIKADHPLSIEFRQLEEEAKSLICKRETIETSVNAAMSGINTDNQLLKVWPEAAELMPKEIKKVQLPAVQTADLNAIIGLPSDKDAA